jgi:hypothetical protein
MRSEQWIAGAAALAVFAGLVAVVTAYAVRKPPQTSPAARITAPAARQAMVCLARDLICEAPMLPTGYPCSCMHPLRGSVAGTVVPMSEADRAAARARFSRPPILDGDELPMP